MTAKLEPSRDPADAQLYDDIGVILKGTRQIAEYMKVAPASIVRWRRTFRGREELHLCFPAMLIPGRGRQWRLFANTKLIAKWMAHWARIDAGNAQAKQRWRRKTPKMKRSSETQKAAVRPPQEGEGREGLREGFDKLTPAERVSQTPASKEPCPCGVPSRCLVHSEWPLEKESIRREEPPKLAPDNPAPPGGLAAKVSQNIRPEGCMCGKGLTCTAHD
jgi:hypothetical protein